MSTQILALLMVLVAFSQIGCDKKPSKQQKAMINSCMYDPTGQCQMRAKAMLEKPGMQAQLNAQMYPPPVLPVTSQNGVVQYPVAANTTPVVNTGAAPPILPADLQQQALKIQSQLEADSRNPRSLYYDPEPGSSAVDRTPSSEQASVEIPAEIAPASVPAGAAGDGAIR